MNKKLNKKKKSIKSRKTIKEEKFNLDYIFKYIYTPLLNEEDGDIKTKGEFSIRFLSYLRLMGDVTRRYSKEKGTFYNIKTNVNTIEYSRLDISTLLDFYPISEMSLIKLYYILLERGIDPNVIEDMILYKEYLERGLGLVIPTSTPILIDQQLIKRKTFQDYLNINQLN